MPAYLNISDCQSVVSCLIIELNKLNLLYRPCIIIRSDYIDLLTVVMFYK
jgi:hypothetical protein